MRFLIITSEARFFQELHSLCRRLHPQSAVEHISFDQWRTVPAVEVPHDVLLIADSRQSTGPEPEEKTEKAFAVIGRVCQNSDLQLSWVSVSRSDFVLWLRDLNPMTKDAAITEDTIVQSQYVRLVRYHVPTRCHLIPALRDRMLKGLHEFHIVGSSRENHFCMALEEALNNAFYHGNLEISSELKEDGSSRFIELAAERELLSPWCGRSVQVTELISAFGLWITIADEGCGFNVQAAIDGCNNPEVLLASGRGLLMMRAFSDELFFNSAGNEVNLVLYAEGQYGEPASGTRQSTGIVKRLVPA